MEEGQKSGHISIDTERSPFVLVKKQKGSRRQADSSERPLPYFSKAENIVISMKL